MASPALGNTNQWAALKTFRCPLDCLSRAAKALRHGVLRRPSIQGHAIQMVKDHEGKVLFSRPCPRIHHALQPSRFDPGNLPAQRFGTFSCIGHGCLPKRSISTAAPRELFGYGFGGRVVGGNGWTRFGSIPAKKNPRA